MASSIPGLRDLLDLAVAPAEVVVRLPALAASAASTLARINRLLDALEEPIVRAKPALDAGLLDRIVVAAGQVPDLVGRVTGVVSQLEGVGEGADDAIALVSLVVGRVEVQVDRVVGVVGRVGGTVDAVDEVVARVDLTADAAGQTVHRVDSTVDAVDVVVQRADGTVNAVDSVVTSAGHAIDEVGQVTSQAHVSIDEIDRVTTQAGASIEQIDRVTGKADTSIGDIDRVTDKAGESIGSIDDVTARASTTVGQADELLGWARRLVSAIDKPVRDLAVPLARIAEQLPPEAWDAIPGLVTRLPPLLERVTDELFPALHVLEDVAPDVRMLRDVVERLEPVVVELQQTLSGLPGAGLLKRRGSHHNDGDKDEDNDKNGADGGGGDTHDGREDSVTDVAQNNPAV